MQIVQPSIEFSWMTPDPLKVIERHGRIAYKSEDKITADSAPKFVKKMLDMKPEAHESVIEHASMSYIVTCDRGVSHEIVRHRLFSYTQESTRYCNYGGEAGIRVIEPPQLTSIASVEWRLHMETSEQSYKALLKTQSPQIARSVLPNSLKTEIGMTANFREWRHFFKLRTAPQAHPQMREIALMILHDAVYRVNVVFDEYLVAGAK